MATFKALYATNMNDLVFESLLPQDFGDFDTVATTPTEIKYNSYQFDDGTSTTVKNTYKGAFQYEYDGNSKVSAVSGSVASIETLTSIMIDDGQSTVYFIKSGWTVSGITADTSVFQTKTDAEIAALILSGDDVITGSNKSDELLGFDGADVLYGELGSDYLNGGKGADVMLGGAGNDTYYVDNLRDVVFEFLGEGTDTVNSTIDYQLGVGLDNLNLDGPGKLSGTGNEHNNKIRGNLEGNALDGREGNDTLSGLAGDDVLSGGAGADRLDGGADTDTASYANSLAGIVASLGHPTTNTGDAMGDIYVSIENLLGSSFAYSLGGTSFANRIDGGSGDDSIQGLSGDDDLIGGDGNDLLIGGAGADKLSGGAGTDTVSYAGSATGVIASLANSSINTNEAAGDTYSLIENIKGSNRDDYVFGDQNANVVDGSNGNDVLKGYKGNDTLIGGAGNDVFVFNSALNAVTNVDAIQDFKPVDDVIWLDNAFFSFLAVGSLNADAFRIGTAAADASDRIIYNSATGAVIFDVDGAGGASAVQFATLGTNLAVTYADFFVI